MTLEAIVSALEAHYGWSELGVRIPVRCFTHEPSIKSSLDFPRKTPWARSKVEGLYLFMLRDAWMQAAMSARLFDKEGHLSTALQRCPLMAAIGRSR
jgi:uncharacterized protein (DUF2132 family)